jgi:hypothetical protein
MTTKGKTIEGVRAEEEVGRGERERKMGRRWRMVGLRGREEGLGQREASVRGKGFLFYLANPFLFCFILENLFLQIV